MVVAADGSSGDSLASTNLPVTLTVDADDAAALTQAASAGEVAVVLIPGN
ncbi:SAF domain-containing protein OS=Streptomyces tendae OX=1932 GN=GUR47_18010 PE=4 SV=1 [Streptomyces tendae]